MPLVVRITLFMLAIIAGLILVVLTLLDVSTVLYLPIGLLALAAAFPLLFLDVGNNSPGAIDNASSVGLVLHLAEVLAQRADWQDKLHLTILIPSAEEMTLMGSVAYVTAYEARCAIKNTLVACTCSTSTASVLTAICTMWAVRISHRTVIG